MEEYQSKVKKEVWISFLISGLFLIFALILLFKEEDIIDSFVLMIGFLLVVFGCIHVLKYFKTEKNLKSYSNDIFLGILFLLFGGIGILRNTVLADMLTYLLGAYLIYKNANRFQICFNISFALEKKLWIYVGFASILGIIFGCLIILNPFVDSISITTLISYFVIISEVINIFQSMAMLVGLGKWNESK